MDADAAWKIFGSFAMTGPWRVELAYHDFGDASCCGGSISDFAFDTESDGFSVGVVYRADLERWHPFAKLGYFGADVEGELVTVAVESAVGASAATSLANEHNARRG